MKRAFNRADQVIHLWANQVQTDAYCSNVFFRGTKIYSYGEHYLLGELVKYKGKTVAVINSTRYSVTTSKHQNMAWSAVSHMPRVWSSDGTVETGLIEMQDEAMDRLFGLFSKRLFYSMDSLDYFVKRTNEFNSTAFELGRKDLVLEYDEHYLSLAREHIKKGVEKSSAKYAEKRAKAEEERKIRQAAAQQDLLNWRQGGEFQYSLHSIRPEVIRVNGSKVETTKGAEVSLQGALDLLSAIKHGINVVGKSLEGFTVRGITMNGETPNRQILEIGCHDIDLTDAIEVLKPYTRKLEVVS